VKTSIYDPKIDSVDWKSVQAIIDALRNSDVDDPQKTLQDRLHAHISQFENLVDDGWPYQEIGWDANNEPIGIPIDLAYMLLSVIDFCAYANIDLASAIEMIQGV
jgi:hypothetical protein